MSPQRLAAACTTRRHRHMMQSCRPGRTHARHQHLHATHAAGHCKKMAPTWSQLADTYAGNESVAVAQVDCTSADAVCKEAGVGGYPTLKTFYNGEEHDVFRGAR